MIWAGLELMGEVPFTDVIIHSTVLAADGRRMSKSLGTGVDPLEMIEAHGADATRYGLLKISSTQDVRFSPGAIEEGRKLANKLWNVSRLILQNAEGIEPAVDPTALEERWILARIDLAREQVEEAWGAFDFATATNVLYHLTFDDFCDWYAEAVKPRLYEHEPAACATALAALERLLALLHPVIPHVTEEIWSHLPGARERLIVSAWPAPDGELSRGEQRPRPRAGGRRDVPAERGAGRTRLRRRAPRLRGRRAARAAEGARRCRPRDRAAAEGDRPRGGDARERALRRQRPRRGRRRRSAPSSSATGASWRRSKAPGAEARPCERGVSRCSRTSTGMRALAAVLAELEREQPDAIVHCGDLTWGPLPAETYELLAGRGVLFVRGNADRAVTELAERLHDSRAEATPRERWLVEHHEAPLRALLAAFAETVELEVDGLGDVLFCHGSPRATRSS